MNECAGCNEEVAGEVIECPGCGATYCEICSGEIDDSEESCRACADDEEEE